LICQDLLQVFQSDSNPFAALQKPLTAPDKSEGEPHLPPDCSIADLDIGIYTQISIQASI
jgi:hypothetical protein